jgi:serine-type D-Ala-D-Ala carboxypeptidase (penicillin-binding protein 5/6)
MICSEPARPSTVWPEHGQGAFVLTGQAQVQAGPNQHPAAIASVAKVTTACVVLCDHPLQLGQDGPTITLTDADADADADADVADTDRRRRQQDGTPARPTGSCAERTHE